MDALVDDLVVDRLEGHPPDHALYVGHLRIAGGDHEVVLDALLPEPAYLHVPIDGHGGDQAHGDRKDVTARFDLVCIQGTVYMLHIGAKTTKCNGRLHYIHQNAPKEPQCQTK